MSVLCVCILRSCVCDLLSDKSSNRVYSVHVCVCVCVGLCVGVCVCMRMGGCMCMCMCMCMCIFKKNLKTQTID